MKEQTTRRSRMNSVYIVLSNCSFRHLQYFIQVEEVLDVPQLLPRSAMGVNRGNMRDLGVFGWF